jgi:hypothetical protein
MTSSPVSWQELIAVIGGMLGLGGVVAGAVCWLWSKFNEQALKLAEAGPAPRADPQHAA